VGTLAEAMVVVWDVMSRFSRVRFQISCTLKASSLAAAVAPPVIPFHIHRERRGTATSVISSFFHPLLGCPRVDHHCAAEWMTALKATVDSRRSRRCLACDHNDAAGRREHHVRSEACSFRYSFLVRVR